MLIKKELNTNKKQFTFPPQEEIEKVIKRMTQPGYRRINKGLLPNASTEDKAKYNFCKSIVHHARKNNLTEKELAKKLWVDQEKIEYILFCHINKLTFKELTNYASILHINLHDRELFSLSEVREKSILLVSESYQSKNKWA